MDKVENRGALNVEYAMGRETKRSFKYRLWRRAYEVLSAIEAFANGKVGKVVDLGTADARMLDMIQQKYPQAHCLGVEYSDELVAFAKEKFPHLDIIQGDIQRMELPDNSFDVAIATAVIEHIPKPGEAIKEVKRILTPGGIFILTSPDPFWEYIATVVGHLKGGHHERVLNLKQLSELAFQEKFTILSAKKFMISPVGMPCEFSVERIFRCLKLDFLMANQILVLRG